MNARVRVKICGVTNEADALAAIECGADALGFNLFPGSSRYIELDREAAWIAKLPPFVTKVAVLVNASLEQAQSVAMHPAIDLVQFHGDEDEEYCEAFARRGRPFIKALRVRDATSLERAERFSTPYVLLDAHAEGAFGGTGLRFDPTLAAKARARFLNLRIILAGGLRPENVAEAVRAANPYAVDVASGVENVPRQKDRGKLAAFITSVQTA